MSYRVFEKKEWRKHIDACWDAQKKLSSCIQKSESYKSLGKGDKHILDNATSKQFIVDYISHFLNLTTQLLASNYLSRRPFLQ